MKNFRFLPYLLLCAAPIAMGVSPMQAADVPANTQATGARTVRDNNDLRTIEVVTDCNETVAQFFARQKLVLVDNANTDGKSRSVEQIVSGKAPKFFASYPLQNDQDFRLYRYGDFYHLEKPSPAVAALFKDDLKLNWKNTMLILAPLSAAKQPSLDLSDIKHPNARLVGRVFIKDRDHWRAEMDAKSLKYREPDAKTDEADKE